MSKETSQPIFVVHKVVDGAHFFSSLDPRAAGMCVAHHDKATAEAEVPRQLRILLQENHGIGHNVPWEVIEDVE